MCSLTIITCMMAFSMTKFVVMGLLYLSKPSSNSSDRFPADTSFRFVSDLSSPARKSLLHFHHSSTLRDNGPSPLLGKCLAHVDVHSFSVSFSWIQLAQFWHLCYAHLYNNASPSVSSLLRRKCGTPYALHTRSDASILRGLLSFYDPLCILID